MPDHLRVGFAVRPDDAPGAEPLATGKDLAALQAELAAAAEPPAGRGRLGS